MVVFCLCLVGSVREASGVVSFTRADVGAGMADASNGVGVVWGDYDGDNDLDVYVVNQNNQQDFLYRNNGNGTFTDVAITVGMIDASYGRGAAWGDYDNDGDLDLFVSNTVGQQDFLYRNNGNGTFVEVSALAGMTDVSWGEGVAWGDYDGDHDLDLFVANEVGQQDFLYQNNGNGTFTNVAQTVGMTDASGGNGAAWGDYDGDGDLDLYVANRIGQQDFLYRNNGNGTFTDVATSVGMTDGSHGVGIAWADYDADGDLDLYVANGTTHQDFLYRNNGNGTSFTDVASSVGMADGSYGIGVAWGDYDGDADLDAMVVNNGQPYFLYQNNGNGTFTEVASSVGITDVADGNHAAWADYDNDGDLDLFIANATNQQDFLYRNGSTGLNYIKVNALTDVNGNAVEADADPERLAIGSTVEIDLNGGANFLPGAGDYVSQMVGMGDGHSQTAGVVHLGVGANSVVDVRVIFPDGDIAAVSGIPVNQTITIKDPAASSTPPTSPGGQPLPVTSPPPGLGGNPPATPPGQDPNFVPPGQTNTHKK